MKTLNLRLFAAMAVAVLSTASAHAWDFSFGYKSVFDTNATRYIVGGQTVRKYTEWQHPPITYWAPSANDAASTLTMRFDFVAPSSEISLLAELISANNGYAYGSSSLWGSTN